MADRINPNFLLELTLFYHNLNLTRLINVHFGFKCEIPFWYFLQIMLWSYIFNCDYTYFRMKVAFHSKYMKCFSHTNIPAKENFREELSILVCMLPYKFHDRNRFRDNVERFQILVLNVDKLQSFYFWRYNRSNFS